MLKGDVLGGLWVVDKLIGEGACAKVYTVTNKKNSDGIEYVAKVIPHAKGKSKKNKDQERLCNTLNYEYMLYTGLLINFDLKPSVPAKFYGDDMVNGVRYLIMEKLDMDLTHYATSFSPLSLSKVAEFGLQILDGLEWFHRNFFIFVDVKPDNFMVKGDKLYFVDCKFFCKQMIIV